MRVAFVLGAAVAANIFFCAGPSRAEGRDPSERLSCAGRAEKAQRLSVQRTLLEARVQLRACAREACPPAVRTDCQRWLAKVESEIPSVVISAQDSTGSGVVDAALMIDGVRFADRLDGEPVELDPGEHTVAVVPSVGPARTERLAVASGEKERRVSVLLVASLEASPSSPPLPAKESGFHPTALAWAAGGVALAAAASAVYFGVAGQTQINDLHATCAGHCSPSDVDAAWTKLTLADVSIGTAVVAGGVAAYLFLTSSSQAHDAPPARSGADLVVGPHAAQLGYAVRF